MQWLATLCFIGAGVGVLWMLYIWRFERNE